jgi:GTPase SAR1 family protein
VFVICFSVTSPASFTHVAQKWKKELEDHAVGVPFLVVGTKADLRDDETQVQALKDKGAYKTFDQYSAESIAIGAQKYLECSALKKEGLKEVFEEAIRAALRHKAKSGSAAGAGGGGGGDKGGKKSAKADSGGGGSCCIIC